MHHKKVKRGIPREIGREMIGLLRKTRNHREVNTTGSKSTDLEITDAVMRMKEDIENLREQIQNLE